MNRTIESTVRGYRTQDGAGVSLVRVLGNTTAETFDPILMLDSFDSTNPADWRAGFPMHPHRGIETVSYLVRGAMRHRDSLGNSAQVGDGEVQWMCAGSGIVHEEMIPATTRLLGVQLWLNLPAADKLCRPSYTSVLRDQIPEVRLPGATVRVLAGSFGETRGHQGSHLPLDYYDVVLDPGTEVSIPTVADRSVMAFTLLGDAVIAGMPVAEKTAVRLSAGDVVTVAAPAAPAAPAASVAPVEQAHVLVMSAPALGEPIAWGGPIVMNTRSELQRAFDELDRGTFLHDGVAYE